MTAFLHILVIAVVILAALAAVAGIVLLIYRIATKRAGKENAAGAADAPARDAVQSTKAVVEDGHAAEMTPREAADSVIDAASKVDQAKLHSIIRDADAAAEGGEDASGLGVEVLDDDADEYFTEEDD